MSKLEGYYHIVKGASGKVHVTTTSKGIIKAVCGSIMEHYSTFKDPRHASMSNFFTHENRCERCEKFLAVHLHMTIYDRDFHNTKSLEHMEDFCIPDFNSLDSAKYKRAGKFIFPIASGSVLHYTSHDRSKTDIKIQTLCNEPIENRSKRDDGTLVQIDRGIIPVYKCTKCQTALELLLREGIYFTIILDPDDEKKGYGPKLPGREKSSIQPDKRSKNLGAKVIILSERKLKPKSKN